MNQVLIQRKETISLRLTMRFVLLNSEPLRAFVLVSFRPKTFADLTPAAAIAAEYRRRSATKTNLQQSVGTITPSIGNFPRAASPAPNRCVASPPTFPLNYPSASLGPFHQLSPGHQQSAPISYVGAEVLAAKSCLAELGTIDGDPCRDGEQEIKDRLSKQPQRVVIHGNPAIQSCTAEISPSQPVKPLLVPVATALPRIKIAEAKEQNNRRDPSGGLQQGRRQCKKAAIDWNERRALYHSAGAHNQLQPNTAQPALARSSALNLATGTPCSPRVKENISPLAEQTCGLRRNGAIRRKEHPYQHLKDSTFANVAQGPNQPVGMSNDGESSLPNSVTHAARRTFRGPLEQLDQNAGLDENEDSEDSNSSYDHPNQAPALEPSSWLGQGFF